MLNSIESTISMKDLYDYDKNGMYGFDTSNMCLLFVVGVCYKMC